MLLGNGASMAVWRRFAYSSLFSVAQSDHVESPLGCAELATFDALKTENFEVVLYGLRTTTAVNRALRVEDQGSPEEAYGAVRRALIDAVRWVHPQRLNDEIRSEVREELRHYEWVYSTNYDLIVYWSMMLESEGEGFVDYFWTPDGVFDPTNTEVWTSRSDWTRVLYLHGALHLERDAWGTTKKRHYVPDRPLLSSFQSQPLGLEGWVPQFVSEGTSQEKQQAISRSAYLTFAHEALQMHDGPMVVFGHSLSDEDSHLVHALNLQPGRTLAISIYPSGDDPDEYVRSEKARIGGLFPAHELQFYDARTHPLGSASLRLDDVG